MENFLNSYAFEQMAREYNKKYGLNNVCVLTKKEDEGLLLKAENAFDKVFHLFYLLKMRFGRECRFKDFFNQANILKIKIKKFLKGNFNKDYIEKENTIYIDNIRAINYKLCGLEILGIFESFFDLIQISISGERECSNGNFSLFTYEITAIYKELLKILKYFYNLV